MVKNRKTRSGKQRYLCKICKATRVENYTYFAYQSNIDQQIIILTQEGLGLRSTARVLQISTTTLLKRILLIAKSIKQPMIPMSKEYKVDELLNRQ
jgi:insertion element IS1 protein InsB